MLLLNVYMGKPVVFSRLKNNTNLLGSAVKILSGMPACTYCYSVFLSSYYYLKWLKIIEEITDALRCEKIRK